MKRFLVFSFFLLLNTSVFAEVNDTNSDNKDSYQEWSEFSFILRPSPIHGVGVFAIHDIAAGTLLMSKSHSLRVLRIKDIPDESLDYCVYLNNEECVCPERFDYIEPAWFINHSTSPNVALNEDVLNDFDLAKDSLPPYSFYAVKDIKAGDEILIDYNSLREPENMREDFYKN